MWTAVFIQRAGFIDLRSVSSLTLLLLFLWQLGISPEVGSCLLPVVIRDLSCLELVCFFLSTSVGANHTRALVVIVLIVKCCQEL